MDSPRDARDRPSSPPSLDELRVEALYHRDRLALYRAKVLTGRPTTPTRLRELERAAASSKARLLTAKRRAGVP